jgi:hypothetical protein
MSRPVIVSKAIDTTAGTIVDPSGELRKYGVQGADIPSAAAINLPTASGDYVRVTGTTNISSLGSGVAGMVRTVEFTGILTLIYNSSNLILPGAVNMVTAPNDVSIFRCRGGNSWICISYQTAAGAPPVSLTPGDVGLGNVENIKLSTWPGSANLTTLGTVTGGVWQATPIAPNKGGTGLTGVTQGDMLYSDSANSIRRLPKNTTQSRYLSNQGGLNNDPDWQLINLANGVTGILPGANGGRGALVQSITSPTGITATIDLALGNTCVMNVGSATGNVTLTFTNPAPGLLCYLIVIQGATIRALTWPAGSVQTLLGGVTWNPSGANKQDVITFFYDGTRYIILGTAPDIG